MSIAVNLQQIKTNIRAAARRAGRDPAEVTIVAVTKTVPAERVNEAIRLGVTHIGENRVQEAREKFPRIDGAVTKHLIGSLQTNKVKVALDCFDLIHSVDRPELLTELARQAANRQRKVEFLFQLNISGEATKHGAGAADLAALLRQAAEFPWLVPRGLMTMAPLADDPETARPVFRKLKELFDTAGADHSVGPAWRYLSMGMSQDYQVAVEEGANLLRIGTAIFHME